MNDNKTILFEERQHLASNPLVWISMIFSLGIVVYTGVVYGGLKNVWPAILILLAVNTLLFLMSIRTRIYKEGIGVTFFPFIPSERIYRYNTLKGIWVRKYNPLREYGGWGFKGKATNRALNISGNMGLQLEMNDGRRLLIGTKRPEEIERVLHRLETDHIIKNEIPVREDRF